MKGVSITYATHTHTNIYKLILTVRKRKVKNLKIDSSALKPKIF